MAAIERTKGWIVAHGTDKGRCAVSTCHAPCGPDGYCGGHAAPLDGTCAECRKQPQVGDGRRVCGLDRCAGHREPDDKGDIEACREPPDAYPVTEPPVLLAALNAAAEDFDDTYDVDQEGESKVDSWYIGRETINVVHKALGKREPFA